MQSHYTLVLVTTLAIFIGCHKQPADAELHEVDQHWLAFYFRGQFEDKNYHDLFLASEDTETIKPLTDQGLGAFEITWSRDMQTIYFTVYPSRLCRVGIDGSNFEFLTDTTVEVTSISGSPMTDEIAVAMKTDYQRNAYSTLPGTGVFKQLSSNIYATDVEWSPDAQHIAVIHFETSNDARLSRLYITDPYSVATIPLTPDSLDVRYPSWSLDSELLAFEANDHLYTVDKQGEITRITAELRTIWGVWWHPTEYLISYYSLSQDGIYSIYIVDPETNETSELLAYDDLYSFNWLPDGVQISYRLIDDNTFYIRNQDGTGSRSLFPGAANCMWTGEVWSPVRLDLD